jgi:hypothetical protein
MSKTSFSLADRPPDKTEEIPVLRQTGTACANIANIQGSSSNPDKCSWGGARNSALRTSHYLTVRQCMGLIEAAEHAEKIELPFNRHWTVHYENAGIAEVDAPTFIRKLLKLAGDYARRRGARLAAVWSRESGKGKGGHVHIILHLPADMPLRGKTRRWVRLAGGKYRKGVSVVRSIAGSLKAAEQGGPHYRQNVSIVRSYGMKAAAVEAGQALGLGLYGIGGVIIGKRCGWTQNIGIARRSINEVI